MRPIRQIAKALLAFLLLFDLSLIYESWTWHTSAICGFANFPCHDLGWLDAPIRYQPVLIAFGIQIILVAALWRSRIARAH
jgi:hypothetical protein